MNKDTKIFTAADPARDRAALETAAGSLRAGGLVVFATETVYGLGANALDADAVAGIFRAKGRPQDNPLIVHVAEMAEVSPLVAELPDTAKRLADAFWPGPLTMILPRSGLVPDAVSAGLSTVAVRMPSHPIARALIGMAGVPVAAPSANRSGRPSPTSAAHCVADLSGRVDVILDSGSCPVGLESTVVTLAGQAPRLLRPGAVTPQQLRGVLGALEIDPAVSGELPDGEAPSSPGMKYKHYAPKARVCLVHGPLEAYRAFLEQRREEGVYALAFEEDCAHLPVPSVSYGARGDAHSQAARLFSALRELDARGAAQVYARAPDRDGVGLAVYNRLVRASGFTEVFLG